MILSKDDIILKIPVLHRELVDVPEWGGSVYVTVLRAGEKDAFEQKNTETKSKNFRARLVAAVVCNENGHKLFNEGDIPILAQHSASALEPIIEAAMRLNKWTKTDMEELEKNSNGDQLDDS